MDARSLLRHAAALDTGEVRGAGAAAACRKSIRGLLLALLH